MKKMIITCALLAFAGTITFAQNAQTAQNKGGQKNTSATNKSKITEEAKSKTKTLDFMLKNAKDPAPLTLKQYDEVYAAYLEFEKATFGEKEGSTVYKNAHDVRDKKIMTTLTAKQKRICGK